MATPQLDTGNIMNRIGDLPNDAERGGFQVQSIQREIDRVRKIDAATGYMLDGILNAFFRDYEGVASSFAKAERLSPADDAILWNHGASLELFARYDEASVVFEKLLDAGNVTPVNVAAALRGRFIILDTESFHRVYSAYAGSITGGDIKIEVENMLSALNEAQRFMGQDPTLKADAQRIVSHVQATLSDQGGIMSTVTSKVSSFYGQNVLHLQYGIDSDADLAIKLNDILLDRIADDEAITNWDAVIPSFVVAQESK